MRFFTGVALLFYVLTISLAAGITILFVAHVLLLEDVINILNVIYSDSQVRTVVGSIAGFIIILSFMFARLISGGRQKERTIAFDNPSGRVTVSLGAVEDMVRRLMYKSYEIKDTKLHIIASKRGIEVSARIVLKSDVSIPEITSRLQEMIRNKIQEILGIEESVLVRIHVVKIITEARGKSNKEESEEKAEPTPLPFHGYRR